MGQDAAVAMVRRFNRFYTRQIGLLNEGLLKSPYSLTECRVIYDLAERPGLTATDLVRDLGLDAGYLSRLLKSLKDKGLLDGTPSPHDGRQTLLSLTPAGQAAFAVLDRDSSAETAGMLANLSPLDRLDLLAAMATISSLLNAPAPAPITLRPHRPGDMGWITHRQALLYWHEYGWDNRFEALVAEICARFIENFDPAREYCWVAERSGQILGSCFLVGTDDPTVAKLRLLYVEAQARGTGLGRRMVTECIAAARAFGYQRLTLWTNANLTAARQLYASLGFTLIQSEPHTSFGHELVGEEWSLTL